MFENEYAFLKWYEVKNKEIENKIEHSKKYNRYRKAWKR